MALSPPGAGMSIKIDPQRRRLSVSQSTEATPAASGGETRRWEDLGLADVVKSAKAEGRKHVLVSSITDGDLKRRASFHEKDISVEAGGVDEDQDAMVAWAKEQGVAWSCRKGLKPESPNQDSFTVLMLERDFYLYCVYDGHGPTGHDVSDFVRTTLVKLFVQSEHRRTNTQKAFEDSFLKCQKEVDELARLDATLSGSTVTMAYHDLKDDKLWVAHVGDSRAVLAKKKGADAVKCDDLTVDHKPDLPSERTRIENSNPPGRVLFDGFYNHRVFSKNGMYPGLNMSRAIGDTIGHKEAGLSAVPDVKCVDMADMRKNNPGVAFTLILCTDGVWEFVESETAATMVTKDEKMQESTEALVKASWDKWMGDSEGEISDDITAIVARLPPAAPA